MFLRGAALANNGCLYLACAIYLDIAAVCIEITQKEHWTCLTVWL